MRSTRHGILSVSAGLLVSCGGGGKSTNGGPSSTHPPKIISFTVNKNPIVEGSSAVLSAVFADGEGTIDNGVGSIESGTPINISPLKDTLYTLTVSNSRGSTISSSLLVSVALPPVGNTSDLGIFGRSKIFFDESTCSASLPNSATSNIEWLVNTNNANISLGATTNQTQIHYSSTHSLGSYQLDANYLDSSNQPKSISKTFNVVGNTFLGEPNAMHPRRYASTARLSDGRYLVSGGQAPDGTTLSTAEVFDPSTKQWDQVGSMSHARYSATSTLLSNGQVLITGGVGDLGIATNSAELFDPRSGSWRDAAPALTTLLGQTSTLLPNGRVLIAGGNSTQPSAELYDPFIDHWFVAGGMVHSRNSHAAALLSNGTVLVTGGTVSGMDTSSCEVYDPQVDSWKEIAPLSAPKTGHYAITTPSGAVWIGGGDSPNCELFDPITSSWKPAASMIQTHLYAPVIQLSDNSIMVVGGQNDRFDQSGNVEIYTPSADLWTPAGSLGTFSQSAVAIPIDAGSAVVFEGGSAFGEYYDAASATWLYPGPIGFPRISGSTTLLRDGRVLYSSGTDGESVYWSFSTLYDPSTQKWQKTGPSVSGRESQITCQLQDGEVLVAGGVAPYDFGDSAITSSAEIYDPTTNQWTETGSLNTERTAAGGVTLPNGKVLIAGGVDHTTNALDSAELFDPSTGQWSYCSSMKDKSEGLSLILLNNGKVLAIGGKCEMSELYDPTTDTWSDIGPLTHQRKGYSVTTMLDGRVLVAGGVDAPPDYVPFVEIYDPELGRWSEHTSMIESRSGHSAVLLPSGKILVVGGVFQDQSYTLYNLTTSEIYNPATDSWSQIDSTNEPPGPAFRLNNDKIILSPGIFSGNYVDYFKEFN